MARTEVPDGAASRPAGTAEQVSSQVLTIPNALSAMRLVGVPVFLYLVLGPERDGLAVLVLMASGISDYLDGKLARRWNQVSRVGQLLDPLADRLYVLATLGAFVYRDVIPWWLAAGLIGRDVLLAGFLPILRRHGYGPLPVNFIGKAATFNLLYAFPMLLAGTFDNLLGTIFRPMGWAFLVWGTALYWWAGVLYARQVRDLVQADRAAPADAGR